MPPNRPHCPRERHSILHPNQSLSMNTRILHSTIALALLAQTVLAQVVPQKIEMTVLDDATGAPVPCRIHLKDAGGKPVRAGQLPFWQDHFVCSGNVSLELAPGKHSYEVEHGPEFSRGAGTINVTPGGSAKASVRLHRIADMAAEGWWSGELHIHRPVAEMRSLVLAEDLNVAPVITWWNNRNLWDKTGLPPELLVEVDPRHFYHVMSGEDEREGGALLYFNLPEPLPISGSAREFPSPMKFLDDARPQPGVWVDIEKPFWWDVPIWLASGKADSIGIAHNHMFRETVSDREAWGKARDTQRYPAPHGNGLWTQDIYYHVLNTGLRVPPSAGSASGVKPDSIGYNRVYVQLGQDFSYAKWWEGLRAGRAFVSNGPLLRCRANGEWPGHVFSVPAGGEVAIGLTALITTRDPISRIEIIRNGRVERSVPFAEWERSGSLGALNFKESGWFLVRTIADVPQTFRFASTAPFYVEIGGQPRVSRASALFFLDWVRERTTRVKLDDPAQRAEVLEHHAMAEKFWSEKVAQANAD